MDEEQLKPCPFCGGEADLLAAGKYFFVHCIDCDAETQDCSTKEDAISFWNMRA